MNKNTLGLSRNIPEKIKKEIRQDAGFGCIFCSSPIIEYEHIEPTFSNAKEHNPEYMTLLCPQHHDLVTRGIISKEKVFLQKKEIQQDRHIVLHDIGHTVNELLIGSNKIEINDNCIILKVDGKPLIWVDSYMDEPMKLSGIFYNNYGIPILYINRNEYTILKGFNPNDITFVKSKLTICDKDGTKVFVMDFAPPIKIVEFSMFYNSRKLSLFQDGRFVVNNQEVSGNTVRNFKTAFKVSSGGQAYPRPKKSIIIKSFSGDIVGYMNKELLFNLNSQLRGYIKQDKLNHKQIIAYSNFGEQIGFYQEKNGFAIIYTNTNKHESGEPIFITNKTSSHFDTSYRLE